MIYRSPPDVRPTPQALPKGNGGYEGNASPPSPPCGAVLKATNVRPPCGVVLVDVWCDERKGWNQHERAGDQLIDVTQREGDRKEKWLFYSEYCSLSASYIRIITSFSSARSAAKIVLCTIAKECCFSPEGRM